MKQNNIYLGNAEPVLERFKAFLLKWQKSINLISPSTSGEIWNRHILDSAQIYEFIPKDAKVLVDMGTGGGFPGVVLAIMNKELTGPLTDIYFVESDIKKSIFLKEVIREFGLAAKVLNERVEKVPIKTADVVTARALKELKDLFKMGHRFITPATTCLFLKGEKVEDEIARNPYSCHIEKIHSKTYENGYILKIGDIRL